LRLKRIALTGNKKIFQKCFLVHAFHLTETLKKKNEIVIYINARPQPRVPHYTHQNQKVQKYQNTCTSSQARLSPRATPPKKKLRVENFFILI